MAGDGRRFQAAGYQEPKPLIDVLGQPMVAWVMANLKIPGATFVLLVRREHEMRLRTFLEARGLSAVVVVVDGLTEGAACTVLLAEGVIPRSSPMLIANSDQWVDTDVSAFFATLGTQALDASILTFKEASRNPKWSYVRRDESGLVVETKEKVAISDEATVGLYAFREAGFFFDAAKSMIAANERVNGEFYVCPAFNSLLASGRRVGAHCIERSAMHGTGTPEDLQVFLAWCRAQGVTYDSASSRQRAR